MKTNQNTFVRRNWDGFLVVALIMSDIIIYNSALVAAFYFRWSQFIGAFENYLPLFIVINVFFVISAALTGLYRGIRNIPLNSQKYNLRRFTWFMALFIMSYLYMTKSSDLSRGVIVIFIFVQYAAIDAFHHIFAKFKNALVRKGIGVKNTIIVGADDSAAEFYNQLHHIFEDDYKICGFLKNGYPERSPKPIQDKILGGYQDIDDIVEKHAIDRVFIVSDSMLQEKYLPIQRACENRNIKLKMVSPITLSLFQSAKIKDITGVPLTTDRYRIHVNKIKKFVKRAVDVILSVSGIAVLSPFLLLTAFAISLSSRGPVLFRQKRSLYKGGSEFNFFKFRTMVNDADEIKNDMNHLNESNGALFKMKNDPRITAVGKILRRYSLDELPQLINVLKGDMSLVGPRPLPIADFDKIDYTKMNYDWYEKRGEIKPGITGLWQISGRSKLSFEEMIMLDLYYIENQSLFFDLEIMFETIPIVLTAKGAY